MTDKEKLARKSLNALFLELPESVATHHQKIVIEALEEAKNISSNLPVSGSLPDIEGQEFYDLMQQYRIAPMENQELVIKCFDRVKEYLRANCR